MEWLNINRLSLNKEKSKYMIFHVPKKEIQTLTLKIDNINIEQVDEFNFLGLTLDTNLTWKKHVNKIANKCCVACCRYDQASGGRWGLIT